MDSIRAKAEEYISEGHLSRKDADGLLRLREDVRGGGVDAFPEMLNRLYSGEKLGKLVLRL